MRVSAVGGWVLRTWTSAWGSGAPAVGAAPTGNRQITKERRSACRWKGLADRPRPAAVTEQTDVRCFLGRQVGRVQHDTGRARPQSASAKSNTSP